jgi:hypothetical protein
MASAPLLTLGQWRKIEGIVLETYASGDGPRLGRFLAEG